MTFPDLPIYLRKYNSSAWVLIGHYASNKIKIESPDLSELGKFSIILTNLFDTDLSIEVGDDIVICENLFKNKVLGDITAGKIFKIKYNPKAFDSDDKPIFEYEIDFQQHDFSTLPLVDINYGTDINLPDLLDLILLNSTSNELGGLLNGVTTITKYFIECDSVTFGGFAYSGTSREVLTEALKSVGLNWSVKYYLQPDNTNMLKLIQQIVISE